MRLALLGRGGFEEEEEEEAVVVVVMVGAAESALLGASVLLLLLPPSGVWSALRAAELENARIGWAAAHGRRRAVRMGDEVEDEDEDEKKREAGRTTGEAIDCTSMRASRSELVDALSMVGGRQLEAKRGVGAQV